MFYSRYLTAFLLILGISSCGSGGGEDNGENSPPLSGLIPSPSPVPSSNPTASPAPTNSSSPTSEPNSNPTASPAPTNSPSPAPIDSNAPTAEINFPWDGVSSTHSNTVTVRGFASDDVEVASVVVNGVIAELTPSIAESSIPNGVSLKAQIGETVSWSAEISLQNGQNEIVVEVKDGAENELAEPLTTEVLKYIIPFTFHLDPLNSRITGIGVDDNFNRHAVSYGTQDSSAFAEPLSGIASVDSCFDSVNNLLYFSQFHGENTWSYRSFNFDTKLEEVVTSYQFDPVSAGFIDAVFGGQIYCDSQSKEILISVLYASEQPETRQRLELYAFSVDNPQVVNKVYEYEADNNFHYVISLGKENVWFRVNDQIISISRSDYSETVVLENYDAFVLELVEDPDSTILYVAQFDGIFAIDTNDKSITPISENFDRDPFELSQVRDVEFDSEAGRLLISDSDLDLILQVDIESGEKSEFLSEGVGEGIKIIAGRDLEVSSDLSIAYVVDSGGNASAKIIAIDLITGDRTWLDDIGDQSNDFLTDIEFDEEAQLLYVSGYETVYEVNAQTGASRVIMSDTVGTGAIVESVSGLLFDAANNRLLITDAAQEMIISISLDDLDREILSAEGVRGTGDAFANINSMSFLGDTNQVVVTNQLSESIQTVDLTTGDRTNLDVNCDNLGRSETLQWITYDESTNNLFIGDDFIRKVDFDSLICSNVNLNRFDSFISGFTPIDQDNAFYLGQNGLEFLNIETGEAVSVSR